MPIPVRVGSNAMGVPRIARESIDANHVRRRLVLWWRVANVESADNGTPRGKSNGNCRMMESSVTCPGFEPATAVGTSRLVWLSSAAAGCRGRCLTRRRSCSSLRKSQDRKCGPVQRTLDPGTFPCSRFLKENEAVRRSVGNRGRTPG
jgi:hypothetical protein